MEEIGGVLGLMDFHALGGLAHSIARELVGLQVEGQGILVGHACQNDAHHVRDREAHLIEHCCSLLFHISVDSGAYNGICGHRSIVAHLSYRMQ